MFNRKSISLIAVLAALGVLGISATSAWAATEVTPAGAAITLTQIGQEPGFVSNNGAAGTSVQCKKASATFTTPAAGFNESVGSVTWDGNPPAFEECAVYAFIGGVWVETETKANVSTNETSGKWTLTADSNAGSPALFINVPPAGASIELVGTGCTITVSTGRPTAVGGLYTNATSELAVAGQIPFTSAAPAGCGGVSPALFAAQYEANNGFEIN